MVHRYNLPGVGDLARIVWGLSRAPVPWFAIRLDIHACCTCGGVTILEILGYDVQLFHAPESLEIEVSILVVEAQYLIWCIVFSYLFLLSLK